MKAQRKAPASAGVFFMSKIIYNWAFTQVVIQIIHVSNSRTYY